MTTSALSELMRRALASTRTRILISYGSWNWMEIETDHPKFVSSEADPRNPLTANYEFGGVVLIERGNYFRDREGAD